MADLCYTGPVIEPVEKVKLFTHAPECQTAFLRLPAARPVVIEPIKKRASPKKSPTASAH